jgi:hypothetical protein
MIITPSSTELAYAAGFLDGEGCITVACNKLKFYDSHFPSVSITNTNREILEWVAITFGGAVYKNGKGQPPRKQAWRWVIWSGKAEAFLRQVRTFLRVKSQQADAMLNLNERNLKATIDLMYILNKRGV